MKVRVERIRSGRRTPEVEYVEARAPRKRSSAIFEHDQSPQETPLDFDHGSPSTLRLPWRINRGQKSSA